MTAALDDDGVFVRSLASRGYLGGLSPAAVRMIDAAEASGELKPGGLVVVRFQGTEDAPPSERKLMADYAPLKKSG